MIPVPEVPGAGAIGHPPQSHEGYEFGGLSHPQGNFCKVFQFNYPTFIDLSSDYLLLEGYHRRIEFPLGSHGRELLGRSRRISPREIHRRGRQISAEQLFDTVWTW